MNQNEYVAAMRRVAPTDGLVQETLKKIQSSPQPRPAAGRWIAAGAMAACFAAAVTAASLFPQRPNPGVVAEPALSSGDAALATSSTTPNSELEAPSVSVEPSQAEAQPSSAGSATESALPVAPSTSVRQESSPETSTGGRHQINLWGLVVNEIADMTDSANRRYYDPAEYDRAVWNMEQFNQYWGKPVRALSIPEDLKEYQPGHGGEVILSKEDGKPVYDTYHFTYAEDFEYEEYRPLRRQARISVSAVGAACDDALYLTQEPEPSNVRGVEVVFGHRRMDYGPYDEQDHTPAGYYDLYAAYFTLDGLNYELVTENLSLEETELILLSLLETK